MDPLMTSPTSIAGWIVRTEGRDVAAGRTRTLALRTARELGFRTGEARPEGPREIDELDLSDAALVIAPDDAIRTDGGRWWATGHCGIHRVLSRLYSRILWTPLFGLTAPCVIATFPSSS